MKACSILSFHRLEFYTLPIFLQCILGFVFFPKALAFFTEITAFSSISAPLTYQVNQVVLYVIKWVFVFLKILTWCFYIFSKLLLKSICIFVIFLFSDWLSLTSERLHNLYYFKTTNHPFH